MIKSIFSLCLILTFTTAEKVKNNKINNLKEGINYAYAKRKKIGIKTLNHSLLNKTVFQLVNDKRRKKGLDTLKYTSALNKVSLKFQDKLELRRFTNTSSIERKINRTLYNKTKNYGFDGGLVIPIVGESKALNYDGKSEHIKYGRADSFSS